MIDLKEQKIKYDAKYDEHESESKKRIEKLTTYFNYSLNEYIKQKKIEDLTNVEILKAYQNMQDKMIKRILSCQYIGKVYKELIS